MRLMYEARFGPVKPLAGDERWKSAIEQYRAFLGRRNPIDDRQLVAMNTALADAGEELVAAHEKAYGRAFPKHILVDVTSYGWQFGAYTSDDAHVVLQSQDNPGAEGFYALESMLHEPSHVIVGDRSGAIGEDIARVTKETGVRPYAPADRARDRAATEEVTGRNRLIASLQFVEVQT